MLIFQITYEILSNKINKNNPRNKLEQKKYFSLKYYFCENILFDKFAFMHKSIPGSKERFMIRYVTCLFI